METLNLRSYAHLGDAVWELFVTEYTVFQTKNLKTLHKITTDRVNSKYQADMLEFLEADLTEEEKDITRRARNCPIPVARRNNQAEYRQSTAFEALIGYWFLHDKQRYNTIIEKKKKNYFS